MLLFPHPPSRRLTPKTYFNSIVFTSSGAAFVIYVEFLLRKNIFLEKKRFGIMLVVCCHNNLNHLLGVKPSKEIGPINIQVHCLDNSRFGKYLGFQFLKIYSYCCPLHFSTLNGRYDHQYTLYQVSMWKVQFYGLCHESLHVEGNAYNTPLVQWASIHRTWLDKNV